MAKVQSPKWLEIAYAEFYEHCVKEEPGPRNNMRIVEYHSTTTLRATDDSVPWCSSFVNWCMRQAGYKGTNSAAARSWLLWGEKLILPRLGCLVVFKRGSGGHVGFFLSWSKEKDIVILGGNQRDCVCEATYSLDSLLGFRWPKEEDYIA